MQLLTFVQNNAADLLALWASVQATLGGLGWLLSKFEKTQALGHRLEALGIDPRKFASGKSRTTEEK